MDKIFELGDTGELRTPAAWAEYLNIQILDPDGWRGEGAPSFHQPTTLTDFRERVSLCTIRMWP